jgi:nickel transport protein
MAALCILAAWGGCDRVDAHKVLVFAWVDGDTVHVESKFSGGRKTSNAAVVVYDLADKPLLQGTTDLQGRFSFKVPTTAGLKVTVGAGMGHRGEWILPAEAFSQDSATVPPTAVEHAGKADSSLATNGCLSAEEVEAIVQRVLDRKLHPILHKLYEAPDQLPSAKDIFGGLGYIMGLVGLLAYWRSHKQP